MAAAESTSDTQMVTPLPSQFLVAFSVPTIELSTAAEHLLESKKKKGKNRHLH